MKQKFFLTLFELCTALLCLVCTCTNAHAIIELYGGKLKLDGFVKETVYYRTQMSNNDKPNHENSVDSAICSGLFEALYAFREDPNFTLRSFIGLKYWWEHALEFDDKLDHYIPNRAQRDYIHPRDFDDDILTEAYIDYINGPLQIKVGKQIVIWGQLDIQRVADVVNPIDLRKGMPGIDSWEEVKRGIWMIRTLYKSQLPGDLQFEGIFNPGDYRGMEIPLEGTHYGPEASTVYPFPGQEFGIFQWANMEKRWRDTPGWNLKDNYEFGFRLSGFTYNVDWTLITWNARDDGWVADPREITPYGFEYIKAGLLSAMTGRSIHPPDVSEYNKRVFYFKRYQTYGGTAQTCFDKLWSTVWRLEWFYERHRPFNLGPNGDYSAINGWTRKNVLGGAIQCSKYIDIPGFTRSSIAADSRLSVALTYFWEKIFNYERDLVCFDRYHRDGDSTTDQLILFMQQDMFHGAAMFIFTGNYYLRCKKWMAVPTISYIFPGKHWRFDLAYAMYGVARGQGYVQTATDRKDSIILRLRYEF